MITSEPQNLISIEYSWVFNNFYNCLSLFMWINKSTLEILGFTLKTKELRVLK